MMRRALGIALIAFGVFLISFAALLKFYAAPKLVTAPKNYYSKSTLQAENATYFDARALQPRTGVTLTTTITTRGDVRAAKDDMVVYDTFVVVEDLANQGTVDFRSLRTGINRTDFTILRCCTPQDSSHRPGGRLNWPIGGIEKTTYRIFDPVTRLDWPAVYSGEAEVNGVKTYRFVMRITDTPLLQMPGLPGGMFGLGEGSVTANRVYRSENTYYVDPRSGIIVNQEQKTQTTLRTLDGRGQLVVADMNLKSAPTTRQEAVDRANSTAREISMVKTVGPLLLLLVGVAALAGGLLLAAGPRGTRRRRIDDVDTAKAAPAR
ncbi:hypothetical protein DPM19_21865 [Actinomadura craniellae]|uniref:DUF3068 domain-containing protein n=1 Tax=Actinomadura craniellae TaxID=2231787 RepID=A0A365H216_9ACTN|nr:DUF3068 domain-containing protein [Actinomadura craniellae]RAY13141.1 hypothetical protein DPM19_21865 [Actinomadura craniellae]